MAVYLDHNATTPLAAGVLRVMQPLLGEGFGNASSRHGRGRKALAVVEGARAEVARLIGAEPEEILFTSGATEANNLAVRGLAPASGGLVVGGVEHPSVAACAARLQAEGGDVALVGPDSHGRIPVAAIRAAAQPGTRLVALMLANNETGVLQPVAEVAALGFAVHTDAVQAVGRVPVDVRALGVSSLSLSGHKLHGPQGVGALYLRRGTALSPLVAGGGQERGLRPGTHNLAGIAGLGEAARLARLELQTRAAWVGGLLARLEQGLARRLPAAVIVGQAAPRLPNTCLVCLPDQDGAALLANLDAAGFEVSVGSACQGGHSGPSPVLLAMGLSPALARGALRISLGPSNQPAEIDAFVEALHDLVHPRRGLVQRLVRRVAAPREGA